jgi:hypothetical protein
VRFGQQRRDAMPGGVRARMTMQEQNRWAFAAVSDAERRPGHFDHIEVKSFEH